jgi:hypothetical protein
MGEIIKLACEKHDYDKTLRIGQGIRDYLPDSYIMRFSKAEHSHIFEADQKYKIKNCYTSLAFCNKCNDFTTTSILNYFGEERVSFISNGECGHESSELDIIDTNSVCNLKCPICQGNISIFRKGFWD